MSTENENQKDETMTDDQIINHVKSKPGLITRIREMLGLDESEENNDDKGENMNAKEVAKIVAETVKQQLDPITQDMAKLKEGYEKYNSEIETTKKTANEKKVDALLEKSIKEGRIAKGEKENWKKKLAEKYNGDIEILEEVLESKPVDENIKKNNSDGGKKGDENDSKYNPGTEGGSPGFKNDDIANMSEDDFAKTREKIQKAEKLGTIV